MRTEQFLEALNGWTITSFEILNKIGMCTIDVTKGAISIEIGFWKGVDGYGSELICSLTTYHAVLPNGDKLLALNNDELSILLNISLEKETENKDVDELTTEYFIDDGKNMQIMRSRDGNDNITLFYDAHLE